MKATAAPRVAERLIAIGMATAIRRRQMRSRRRRQL
jgi:hypothetical protein